MGRNNRSLDTGIDRRQYLKLAGATAGLSAVAGCSQSGDSPDNGGTSPTDGMFTSDMTVTHWPLLLYSPPYQVAMEKGYFEEEGLKFTDIVGSSGGGTTVRNVVTGGLPFGEVATPAAVKAFYAGAPLSIIAGSTNTLGTLNWVAPKGSDIQDMTDLEGKTVGFTSAGSVTQNSSALAVKRADGISVDDVEFKAMGGVSEGLTAVKEGGIAAAANLDPVFSKQMAGDSEPWQVVFWAKNYVDAFQQTSIIAGPDILENEPDVVRGFLRARARGVKFIQNNMAEAAEIFASFNDGYSADVMQSSLENVEPNDYYVANQFSKSGLQNVQEGMQNIDLIDRNVEWSKIVDQSFLPEDKRIDL